MTAVPQQVLCAPEGEGEGPLLGSTVRDEYTGIDGRLIAITHWHDRSDEVGVLRPGVDHDGKPFDVFWFPVSRMMSA